MIKILYWTLVVLTIPASWFYHRNLGNHVAAVIGFNQALLCGPILITIIAWSISFFMEWYFKTRIFSRTWLPLLILLVSTNIPTLIVLVALYKMDR